MLSLVHLIYMAGDKCMRQNAYVWVLIVLSNFFTTLEGTQLRCVVQFLNFI